MVADVYIYYLITTFNTCSTLSTFNNLMDIHSTIIMIIHNYELSHTWRHDQTLTILNRYSLKEKK